jgi:hypothetical protein
VFDTSVEDIRVERIEATPVVDPPRIWLNAGRDNDYTRRPEFNKIGR